MEWTETTLCVVVRTCAVDLDTDIARASLETDTFLLSPRPVRMPRSAYLPVLVGAPSCACCACCLWPNRAASAVPTAHSAC